MEIAQDIADKAQTEKGVNYDTIILTSESREIMDEGIKVDQAKQYPFRFVMNTGDVTQGSGFPGDFTKLSVSADEIMLSTMMALKMQLLGASTVGNCCSNFHKMMQMYNGRGCGSVRKNSFKCLEEMENPDHRVCCQWSRGAFCRKKRVEFRKEEEARKAEKSKEEEAVVSRYIYGS